MKEAVALVVIFNNHYPGNIQKLESIYGDRFSNIIYLLPFAEESNGNVVTVFGHSYYFQGYISQFLHDQRANHFDYFIFIADDLLLNPKINQHNFCEWFGVDPSTAFIPSLINVHEHRGWWRRAREAALWETTTDYLDIGPYIPSASEAESRIRSHGMSVGAFRYWQITPYPPNLKSFLRYVMKQPSELLNVLSSVHKTYRMNYPLIGGYSDMLILPYRYHREFRKLTGAFATGRLFVELALPTALALTVDKIVTEKSLDRSGLVLWDKCRVNGLHIEHHGSVDTLLQKFSDRHLYIHPIKLSEWVARNE